MGPGSSPLTFRNQFSEERKGGAALSQFYVSELVSGTVCFRKASVLLKVLALQHTRNVKGDLGDLIPSFSYQDLIQGVLCDFDV